MVLFNYFSLLLLLVTLQVYIINTEYNQHINEGVFIIDYYPAAYKIVKISSSLTSHNVHYELGLRWYFKNILMLIPQDF